MTLLTAKVETDHLFKHIIFKNKQYLKERWRSLNEEEKEEYWNWARHSKETREVRQMEKEFTDKTWVKSLALLAKEKKKKKIIQQMIGVLECCK